MTPWTAAYQAPPSMGFSRQEYWTGVPWLSLRREERIEFKRQDRRVSSGNIPGPWILESCAVLPPSPLPPPQGAAGLAGGHLPIRRPGSFNTFVALLGEGFPGGSAGENPPANARVAGSIPGSGRSPGEGNGSPLQYPCLGSPTDRGAWQAVYSPQGRQDLDTT